MTSPRPAFQECTGSFHDDVPAPMGVSFDLQSTDGLTALTRIGHLGTLSTILQYFTHNETQ